MVPWIISSAFRAVSSFGAGFDTAFHTVSVLDGQGFLAVSRRRFVLLTIPRGIWTRTYRIRPSLAVAINLVHGFIVTAIPNVFARILITDYLA